MRAFNLPRRWWIVGCLFIMAAAAGCYQPAGSVLEATSVAQGAPTFTLTPSDTPPPTETPTDTLFPTMDATETPTPTDTSEGTFVAQLDPFAATATAFSVQQTQQALLATGGEQPDVQIQEPTLDTGFVQPDQIDPLFLTATQMVFEATQTQFVPLTQTSIALTAFAQLTPTATPTLQGVVVPTTGGPIISGEDCIHEVRAQDRNLFRIGLAYGVPYQQIATASNIVNPNLIYVGQRLVIPGCGTTGFQPPPTSTPTSTSSVPQPGITPGGPATCTSPWLVEQGDTLFQISLACNRSVRDIANANSIVNWNLIFIGDSLIIP